MRTVNKPSISRNGPAFDPQKEQRAVITPPARTCVRIMILEARGIRPFTTTASASVDGQQVTAQRWTPMAPVQEEGLADLDGLDDAADELVTAAR
jgi:hypothetical protein